MKSSIILLASFSLLGTVLTFRDLKIFMERIDVERCLGGLPENQRAYAQYEPIGYTLESFISLVEKIEYHHPQMNIFELTNMILERFYFPNLYFKQVSGQRKPAMESQYRHNLLKTLLPSKNSNNEELFQEGELTENEKCSLYFMIAHNINNTYRGSIDDPKTTVSPDSGGSSQQGNRQRIHPREQGVVSLHSDPISAVAMGRVLVGIAAGEYKDMKKTLGGLPGNIEVVNREKEMDVLTALTVGDAIASAEHESELKNKLQTTKYGPPGSWNNSTCPIDYTLSAKNTSTTDAELRGSIDGYIIGSYVKRLHDDLHEQLKLSRLIRMYYSGRGIRIGSETIGFCQRSAQKESLQNQMVYSTAETVFIYLSSDVVVDEALLNGFRENLKDYNTYLDGLYIMTNGRSKGYHGEYNICSRVTAANQAEYDTPVDLFVVLDVTEHNTKGIQDQVDVVGHLAGHMDIGHGAGSVTVLLNSRGGQVYIKNETNSACATCQMTRMDLRNVERDNLASVLELLNRTLKEYEETRRYEAAVPAKAVIFFHYDTTVDEDTTKLKEAKRILSYGHRDVHIFAIGTNSDVLDKIATDKSTKFTEVLEPVKLADRIREEIKKVPATLQYHECGRPRSTVEDHHYYTGYVTPNTKQMWAMYPEYFLKSYNIEFKFKAEASSGKIKVCHSREHVDPSLDDNKNNKRCYESENNGQGQEIKIAISNPCQGYSRDNCHPFYFSVEGLSKDMVDVSSSCNDVNCRRTDQIKFTVSHKGVACSGALGLLASPLVLLAVIYATMKYQ